ncbi:MAG TPA: J domain-containing protein [Pedococcus sp.]|nr:J domain-containing protein [Pedococcus sp.]
MTMTVEWTDPYAVLGLSSRATQTEIRRAYRALVRLNHPDTRAPGDPASGAASNSRLQQIIAAYATLGDPARRAEHDQRITQGAHTRPSRVAGSVRRPHPDDQPPIQAGPVHWHPSPRPAATT